MRWSASALRRFCAYPKVLDVDRERTPDQQRAIDRGVAFHAAVERWAHDGSIPVVDDLEIQGWLDLLATQWDPLGKRLEVAWGLGEDGSHVMVSEPRPHCYEPLSGGAPLLTAGRNDAAWLNMRDTLFVADWKTGVWPVEPAATNLQINAAGLALARRWNASAYVPGVYYARDGVFDWGDPVAMGSDAAARIFADVKASAQLPAEPIPGDHCAGCWSRKRCPAAA